MPSSPRPRRCATALLSFFALNAAARIIPDTGGLDVEVTRIGDCTKKAQDGDMLWVDYRGTLKGHSDEFDSSYSRHQPFGFHLGQGEVIKGWDLGMVSMCLGEARTLTIPPSLGYGDGGAPPKIPGGSTLVFTTELKGINSIDPEALLPPPSPANPTPTPTPTPSEPAAVEIATAQPETANAAAEAMLPPDLPVTDIPPPQPTAPPQEGGDEDNGECELLGPFALVVQATLGALALCVLVIKRLRESPRRPMKIWFFDASKQVFGSMLLHILNLLMSMLSSGQFDVATAVKPGTVPPTRRHAQFVQDDVRKDRPNPCSFYLLNLAIDTTIGIPILVILLRVLHVLFAYSPLAQPPESIRSGNYGHPPRATWWLKQSLIYFLGLFGMKLCVWVLFQILPWIAWVGDWALSWTEGNEALQIAFVMLVFPLVMNALQYWIIDSFIKDPTGGDGAAWQQGLERTPLDEEERALVGGGREDEDGDLDADDAGPLKEEEPIPVPAYEDRESRATGSAASGAHSRVT